MDSKDLEIARLNASVAAVLELATFALERIPEEVRNTREFQVEYLETLKRMNAATAHLPRLEPEALPATTKAMLEVFNRFQNEATRKA